MRAAVTGVCVPVSTGCPGRRVPPSPPNRRCEAASLTAFAAGQSCADERTVAFLANEPRRQKSVGDEGPGVERRAWPVPRCAHCPWRTPSTIGRVSGAQRDKGMLRHRVSPSAGCCPVAGVCNRCSNARNCGEASSIRAGSARRSLTVLRSRRNEVGMVRNRSLSAPSER